MSLLAPVSRVGVGGALLGCGTGKVLFDLITGLESLLAAAERTKGCWSGLFEKRHLTKKRGGSFVYALIIPSNKQDTLTLWGLVCVLHVYEDIYLYGGHRPT